jgi:hypothetical protein
MAVEEIAGRVPFLPGTGSAKLEETLDLTDAALVITPYARPTAGGRGAQVRAVARIAALLDAGEELLGPTCWMNLTQTW